MVRATSRGDGGEGELICRQGRAGIHEPVDGYIMWINRASPTCVDAGDGPGRGGGPMPVGLALGTAPTANVYNYRMLNQAFLSGILVPWYMYYFDYYM